jgi:TRAP-type C4-dicarboxylate transport system permease small subunit
MLEKFEKFNRTISSWIEWIGFGALFLMMVLTCVDVIGAKMFRTPVFGALDIMMLAQLIAISFAVSMALILGRHVHVEFFIILMPRRIRKVIEVVVNFLGLLLFVVIVWRLIVFGYDIQIYHEESATARIRLFPFIYAAALACVPVCLVYLQQLLTSIRRAVKNES